MTTKQDDPPPEPSSAWHLRDDAAAKERRALVALGKRIRTLDAIPRAEAWLRHIVEFNSGWGDDEAIAYLISHGHDLGDAVEECRRTWRAAAAGVIRQCAEGMGRVTNAESGEVEIVGGMPLHDAERVKDRSVWELRNFWLGLDHQELHLDASMLRTAEACEIGGFDEWWERLFEHAREEVLTGIAEAIPGSYWLFSMVRSRLALAGMPDVLCRTLERICIKECRNEPGPWRFNMSWLRSTDNSVPPIATHNAFAANLAFSSWKLERQPSSAAKGAALEGRDLPRS